MAAVARPASPRRIPSALTQQQVAAVLFELSGDAALIARLLYGTGMRLMEGLHLRVKDLDLERQVIIVRQAKGGKDRAEASRRSRRYRGSRQRIIRLRITRRTKTSACCEAQ